MSAPVSPTFLVTGRPKSKNRPRAGVWIKRGMLGLAAAVVGFGVLGAVYQAVADQADRRAYPPPGQLVDIGGRRIHMFVTGESTGHPTVILEAGMATFSSNWAWVQSDLAATTRVVSYDRAGLGWSDPSPEPQDAQQSAQDLHAALQKAGIQGPYIVAGHSYGGLVARAFTNLYPNEVVGMVLVDASHPDQWTHIPASRDGKLNGYGNQVTALLARIGVVRLLNLGKGIFNGLPEQQAAEMRAALANPGTWKNSGDVILIWNERTRPFINQTRDLGSLPLGVISVTEQALYADVLTSLQNELAGLSSNSFHYIEEGATHEGLVAEREHAAAVGKAIRKVMEAAESGRPLSQE